MKKENTWANLREAIKNYCELHDIAFKRFDIKKFEVASENDRYSTTCYYTVRKGICLYIDWDFLRDCDNEIDLIRQH